jgi:hypothetical protein
MEEIADRKAYEAARRSLQASARYRNRETRAALRRMAGQYALKALGLHDGTGTASLQAAPAPQSRGTPRRARVSTSTVGVRAFLDWVMRGHR